ncbi:MAG: HAD-IIIA family hydrolase [Candidatus Omnitrophica bacterium]|nr:HAD-IIIA family hydrolase [Candidatus Omnitrophota bacterium]
MSNNNHRSKNKIIFLDRDGVINEFPGNGKYVTRCRDFHFIPGSLEGIQLLTKSGYKIFVISNQAGVGKKIFSERKLNQITRKMLRGVKISGGRIKKVYYSIKRSNEGCQFRKPNIGSIRKALASMNKDLKAARGAYFIGDTESDIKTGRNAGCKTIFVLSGREDCLYMRRWDDIQPDFIFRDLRDAAKYILGLEDIKPISRRSKLAKVIINKKRRKVGINLHRRSTD